MTSKNISTFDLSKLMPLTLESSSEDATATESESHLGASDDPSSNRTKLVNGYGTTTDATTSSAEMTFPTSTAAIVGTVSQTVSSSTASSPTGVPNQKPGVRRGNETWIDLL